MAAANTNQTNQSRTSPCILAARWISDTVRIRLRGPDSRRRSAGTSSWTALYTLKDVLNFLHRPSGQKSTDEF